VRDLGSQVGVGTVGGALREERGSTEAPSAEIRAGECLLEILEQLGGHAAGVRCRVHRAWWGGGLVPPGAFRAPEPRVDPSVGAGVMRRADVVPCVLARRGRWARWVASELLAVLDDAGCGADLRGRVLTRLAASPEPSARVEAARDPATPDEVLALLGRDWWWEVRSAVAANPARPVPLARALARDESPWVRRALAEHAPDDDEVLEVLAADADQGIRDTIAECDWCPPRLQLQLARDPVWEIRRSIAKRPDAPAEALVLLAVDAEHWVRFFVARHPSTPPAVRAALRRDRRPTVRLAARLRRRGAEVSP
jgi:hypothetical protein